MGWADYRPRRLKRRLRRGVREILGREPRHAPRVLVPLVRLGSDYGGWTFTPTTIGSGSIVYSVGVGTDVTFDLALIDAYGVDVFAFDPTPKSTAWIAAQSLPAKFHFVPWGLGVRDGSAIFTLTTHPDWTSYQMGGDVASAFDVTELPIRRLSSIMSEFGHAALALLKMDIEGAEFDVIEQLVASEIRVDQILVEFHYRRGNRGDLARVDSAVRSLESVGLTLIARSDGGSEFSFARLGGEPRPSSSLRAYE